MLPIKSILVATDFSPMSEHAFRFAGALARDYGARLILVHVIRPMMAVYAETAVMLDEPDHSAAPEAIDALDVPGIPMQRRLLEGDPGLATLQPAAETDRDLIVMG